MRSRPSLLLAVLVGLLACTSAPDWDALFDGETMDGWERKTVHGGQGGVWTVQDGALVADQAPDHTGGLLGTTRAFGDFEAEIEFNVDHPVDSGLFLRTRPDGMGYQVTIDYREGGYVGSLYAPAEGGYLVHDEGWEEAFRPDGWNRLRVRVEGQPARIQAWLNGVQTLDYTDDRARYPRTGYLGLQVHGGEGSWGADSRARFRTVRVREL